MLGKLRRYAVDLFVRCSRRYGDFSWRYTHNGAVLLVK